MSPFDAERYQSSLVEVSDFPSYPSPDSQPHDSCVATVSIISAPVSQSSVLLSDANLTLPRAPVASPTIVKTDSVQHQKLPADFSSFLFDMPDSATCDQPTADAVDLTAFAPTYGHNHLSNSDRLSGCQLSGHCTFHTYHVFRHSR